MKSEDDIAIVGIACNFPGGEGIDSFWQVLVEGRNCTVEIPPERFNTQRWYDPDTNQPGKIYTTRAALLDEFNMFDNKLFGIPDLEAERMDPQQKLLLECTYRTLEDAGIPIEDISGTKTGVFIGLMNHDYEIVTSTAIKEINHYDGTGVAVSIAANRISYAFNLTGPSLAIDTACSSFFYALHYALHAIKQGDCEAAFCGGVSCIIDPRTFVSRCKTKIISPDGMSKPFSKKADGYGRGEGCGVILLKPLKKAQEDFNKIWGIISISAVNQDGRSATPITRPSQQQQENLLLSIYPAHVDPSAVQYVEAHGTGTPTGDSTEAETLGNIIGRKRSPKVSALKMGSVKGNIGHPESAAGAAGLIKVLLMMHHGKIVPSLHFSESNSSINTEKLNLCVPTMVERWDESSEYGRVAGVNCFGFGGTNAHVVVRQVKQAQALPPAKRPAELFVISAASRYSLKQAMEDTARHVNTNDSATLPGLAYTSACRRSHINYKYRKAFLASSLQHLEQQLSSAAEMEIAPSNKPPELVFVFSGNGLNLKWIFGTLLRSEPVFRDKCKEIEELFQNYFPIDILELTEGDHEDLSRPEIAQPLLFTLQVALVTLLQSWGIKPTAAVGHSVGEVAAAHCAGFLSLEDAVKVIYHRSRLQAKVPGGQMLVIGNIPVEEVSGTLGAYLGKVCVAAFNGPQSCTLSGDADSINALQKDLSERFSERNLFLHALNVPVAYHSHMMDPVLAEMATSLSELKEGKPELEVFSTVTGKAVSNDFFVGRHWARQARDPVCFAQAIMTSAKNKEKIVFIEVGPQKALQRYITETLGTQTKVFPSLQTHKEYETLLTLVKGLFELGFNPDWKCFYEGYQSSPVAYPRYQFDRKKLLSYMDILPQQTQRDADLSHSLVHNVSNDDSEFRCTISQTRMPYLYEHKHNGVALVPGAFFVQLALTAVMTSSKLKVPLSLYQISMKFTSPCVLTESTHDVKVKVESQESVRDFKILSSSGAVYALGQVTKNPEISLEVKSISLKDVLQRCSSVISQDEIYETLSSAGFQYGSIFKQLSGVYYCEELKEAITIMKVNKYLQEEMHTYSVHPVLLDCFLQMTLIIAKTFKNRIGFPSGISSLVIVRPLEEEMMIYLKTSKSTENYLEFCGCFTDKHGSVLAEMKHVGLTFIGTSSRETDLLFENKWKELPHSQMIQHSGRALRVAVFADTTGVSQQLKRYLHKDSKFFMYEDWEKFLEARNSESTAQDKVKLEVEGYNDVLFLWGIQRLSEENPDSVVAGVSKCCEAFRQLVIALRGKNCHCSIKIITYRTANNVDHINPGFALYGMARTCKIEVPEITFQMIDIGSTSTIDVSVLADVLAEYEAENYPEIWINQGRVYTSEIRRTQTDDICSNVPSQSLQNSKLFTLYTSVPYEVGNLYGELTDDISVPLDKHSVEVQIEKISIHSEDYFPVSLSSLNFGNTLYWNSQTMDKHKLLALDCSGTIVATGCKVKKLRVGDHIVSCYPVVASSRIRIPEAACFNTQKFPCFETTPCVSFFRMAWEILHQMLPKMKQSGMLGIVSPEPQSVLCKVLIQSAQNAGWKTISTVLDSNLEQRVVHCNALVFLPPLERFPKDVLARLSRLQDVVVACSNYHSESLDYLFGSHHENFHIHVLSLESIFQKASLKKSHKAFLSWMKAMPLTQRKHLPSFVFQQREDYKSTDTEAPSHFTCKSVPCAVLKSQAENHCISEIPISETKGEMFQQNAVYIVAGGLTGLGFETVKFIVQNGGGCIVILSRRKPNSEKEMEISNLKNQYKWSRIISLQCNITFKADVDRAINSIRKVFPKCQIKGVFHSAVVLHDGWIETLTISTFEKVLNPKIVGAINLHHATQGQDLDYFVCYSSVSSFLGNSMQANYAAANSFLDLFCQYRRNCGLPGQSINWGAFNLGVLQNQNEIQNILEAKGIEILQVNDLYDYLKRCLLLNNPQQAVMRLNFQTFISQNPSFRYRMHAVITEVLGSNFHLSKQIVSQDLDSVKSEDYIMSLVSQLTGTDASEIAMNTSVLSLGMDSMLAMTLRNHILQEKRVDIPVVKLLDPHATVLSLASLLDEQFNKIGKLKQEHCGRGKVEEESWSVYL
ncbi:phenolphthiocerol/phthiocerol polyketide synthase subunit C-like [Hemicordylus capensis]|uniref:phenolphthiocerol/phthiocerol polyketide synthase subunit C-like n=1 Tax=Hemicordylus capensis TaxID=884348 RepID=UPI0023039A8E|nr:phenolphthiocerol/phthiocerol polyketide synthase subunit C-like [Hemicordylus capensis]